MRSHRLRITQLVRILGAILTWFPRRRILPSLPRGVLPLCRPCFAWGANEINEIRDKSKRYLECLNAGSSSAVACPDLCIRGLPTNSWSLADFAAGTFRSTEGAFTGGRSIQKSGGLGIHLPMIRPNPCNLQHIGHVSDVIDTQSPRSGPLTAAHPNQRSAT